MTPGKVWVTDRRATRRHFLFSPKARRELEPAFWYCLAHCAAKHGIVVHAALLMSTHIHLVYTDAWGVQPFFKRDFHRLFAQCVKAILGWPEEVFNKHLGGEREPLGDEATLKAIGYLIANPAMAFAVRYAKDWPGPKTLPADIGTRVIRASRPDCFFDPNNPDWPDEVELRLEMPEVLEGTYGAEQARCLIAEDVARREQEALSESKKHRIAFKGVRRVERTPHTARARSYELFGKVNPRFSAAGNSKLAQAKVRELREFDAAYDKALARWMAGDRRAVFPYGHLVDARTPPRSRATSTLA